MHDLILLCPHVPRPAVSGQAGRIWRMLRYLAARYRIHLGCFGAEEVDRRTEGLVRQFCHSSYIARPVPQFKSANRLAAALGLGTAPTRRHPGLWAWAERVWRERCPTRALAVGAPLAPYAMMRPEATAVRIVDHADLACGPDAGRWGEPSGLLRGVRYWSQRGEARALLAQDRRWSTESSVHLFPSARLAARFRNFVPWAAERIHDLPDGIDLVHFSERHAFPNPSPHPGRTVLLGLPLDAAGAEDAAVQFARTVFPRLRGAARDLRFLAIGGAATGAVAQLASLPGVTVVPRAEDFRPWLARAEVVVFPVAVSARQAILEAMAMARPVVASSAALADLDPISEGEIWRADGVDDLADAIRLALDPAIGGAAGCAARARVQADYSWEAMMERLDGLLDGRPIFGAASAWPIASGLGR